MSQFPDVFKPNEDAIRSLVNALTDDNSGLPVNPAKAVEVALSITATTIAVVYGSLVLTPVLVLLAASLAFGVVVGDGSRAQFRALILQEIETHYLSTLVTKRNGILENINIFRDLLSTYDKATSEDKEELKDYLRIHYIGLFSALQHDIADFQNDKYAAAALLDFTNMANLHVTVLAAGIQYGEAMGLSRIYIDNIVRPQFARLTGCRANATTVQRNQESTSNSTRLSRRASHGMQMQLLADAIRKGEDNGWSTKLLKTWKDAYSSLSVQRRDDGVKEDYPTYVKRIYKRGRKLVKPWELVWWVENYLTPLADYDSLMVKYALSFAELWPYVTGECKAPQSVFLNLDREIFSGPYGWGKEFVTWDTEQTSPPTARVENISSLIIREGGGNINGIRKKTGDHWDDYSGSETDGSPDVISLHPTEYIENVDTVWDDGLLWNLRFTTNSYKTGNRSVHGWYGSTAYREFYPRSEFYRRSQLPRVNVHANHSGYALSSIYCTDSSSCKGVVLGWRPLYFSAGTHEPSQNVLEELFAPLMDIDFWPRINTTNSSDLWIGC